ncbi:MAG TPA: hypothetical protein VM009_04900 [Terriglobales bacterium]|nr:hypothetical protein [Terriglobales bacterium]
MPHHRKYVIKYSSALCAMLVLVVMGVRALAAAPSASDQTKLADSMDKKIGAVRENGAKARPTAKTTVFTQDEVNAYFAERRVPKMPEGVRSVRFVLSADSVLAKARIDFDDITRSRRTSNPLMYLFSGVHNVEVIAKTGNAGPGMVHAAVESVTIDGVSVPRMALQFFIDRFVNPKYPQVDLDQDYKLPAKMDSVVIGAGKGTVTQK